MRKKLIKSILVTSFLAVMLYACQKEYEELSNSRDFSVEEARVWYEAHKPEYIELKSGGNEKKMKYIKPDWSRSIKLENNEEEIVETEIQTNGGFGFATAENLEEWEITHNRNYILPHTKLVVVNNKKTKDEVGFLMTVVGDKSYIEKTGFNMNKNHYKKVENDFSGYVFFHNLDGSFSNGWKYSNGTLTHTASVEMVVQPELRLKSAPVTCVSIPIYNWYTNCLDYYWCTYDENGEKVDEQYVYTRCEDVQVYAGTVLQCTESSGGGTTYTPPGGGGYTGGTTQPALTIPDRLKPFIGTMKLTTQSQIDKLDKAFEEFKNGNCGNRAIYNKLLSLGTKFTFGIKSMDAPASYNPFDKSISFKDESSIKSVNLEEELFHAWQDNYYSGGISSLLISPYTGRSNMEIEVRVYREIMHFLSTDFMQSYDSNSFYLLVEGLVQSYRQTNQFPSQLTNAQKQLFINSVNDLKIAIPAYNYPTDNNQYPNALMNILGSVSGCLVAF